MSDIRFDTEQEFARPLLADAPRGLTALVMKWGLAKDEKAAQYVLLGIAGGAIFVALMLPLFFGGGGSPQATQSQVNAAMQRVHQTP